MSFYKVLNEIQDGIFLENKEINEIMGTPTFSHFSDSFVISEKIENNDKEFSEQIIPFLMKLRLIIGIFARNNILVRGGVTCGKLFHKKNLLFGPAMNEAYILESKEAIFPRVILSKIIKERLKSILHERAKIDMLTKLSDNKTSMFSDLLIEDSDGYVFINYDGKGLYSNIPTNNESLKKKHEWMHTTFG